MQCYESSNSAIAAASSEQVKFLGKKDIPDLSFSSCPLALFSSFGFVKLVAMEGRPRKMRIDHPPKPKTQTERKRIPVVYYLCRNMHLDQPHFIEVPCSSEALYLKDVINRLNSLRGKGMAAMYSWSCKRLYKGGFVWQDLAEDDPIPPAQENEYVLKGSERMNLSSSDHPKAFSRLQRVSPSLSSPELPAKAAAPPRRPPAPPSTPPPDGDHSPWRYRGALSISTQTDERAAGHRTRGVSTEETSSDRKFEGSSEISSDDISPPPTSSSASSSAGKTETLDALIRADEKKTSRFTTLEEEELSLPAAAKIKAAHVLMNLITCGSISVKDGHGGGFVSACRPRIAREKLASPSLLRSRMEEDLDGLFMDDNPRNRTVRRIEEKEYFSGSVLEMKNRKDCEESLVPTLKRSSSYNAEMNSNLTEGETKKMPGESGRPKGHSRTENNSSAKEARNENEYTEKATRRESKRHTAASAAIKEPSSKSESFREKDRTFKIEESSRPGLGL
ncbi:protein SOSEKI 3-like [Wolffia australiana]